MVRVWPSVSPYRSYRLSLRCDVTSMRIDEPADAGG